MQHAAAWPIFILVLSGHITDAFISPQRLRIPELIRYKVAVLTYEVPRESAPRYLEPLICVSDLLGRHALRSAGTNRLMVPSVKLSSVGWRIFSVAGPRVGNNLPCSRCQFSVNDSRVPMLVFLAAVY
jgi:hypothetical protein